MALLTVTAVGCAGWLANASHRVTLKLAMNSHDRDHDWYLKGQMSEQVHCLPLFACCLLARAARAEVADARVSCLDLREAT